MKELYEIIVTFPEWIQNRFYEYCISVNLSNEIEQKRLNYMVSQIKQELHNYSQYQRNHPVGKKVGDRLFDNARKSSVKIYPDISNKKDKHRRRQKEYKCKGELRKLSRQVDRLNRFIESEEGQYLRKRCLTEYYQRLEEIRNQREYLRSREI